MKEPSPSLPQRAAPQPAALGSDTERDAARYRWLMQRSFVQEVYADPANYFELDFPEVRITGYGADKNAAIDAAMGAPSRKGADTARPGSDEQDAPASPALPQGEREAFEAWAEGFSLFFLDRSVQVPDTYANSMTHAAWRAFQAGRASLRASTQPAVSAEVRDAARLDWLDATNKRFRMGWKVGVAPAGNCSVQVLIMGGQPIREAIDAAMGTPPADNKENGNGR